VKSESSGGTVPGLVLYYNDGRIEMYRDDKEYQNAMRQRAREK
jgi:hypothetical protein